MRRYKFLGKDDIYNALNRLRDAFLAARDGNEVESIINALLTSDEKIKIGRRIQVAELLADGTGIDQIIEILNVGKTTISLVDKNMDMHSEGFLLIHARRKKVEHDYKQKRYREVGGSKLVFKEKVYTGLRRSDIKR